MQPIQPLRFKLEKNQLNVRYVRAFVIVPLLLLLRVATLGPWILLLLVLYVPAVINIVVVSRKAAVTLTPQGITRWLYGDRFTPWHQVQRIEPRTRLGTKSVRIVLTDGSRKRCCPM